MRKFFIFISICSIVTLTACSSGSTNSSLGLNIAGIWRGNITSRFSGFRTTFVMTLRQADNTTVCDGTLAFEGPDPNNCFIGGEIVNCNFVGSRISFELQPALEPNTDEPVTETVVTGTDADGNPITEEQETDETELIPGGAGEILFTANASEDRMEGTFAAVSPGVCGNEAGNWNARPRGF